MATMPDVRTQRRERITSNEEDRRRRGYLIDTYYQFAPRSEAEGGGMRIEEADLWLNETALFRITYAPSASLLRVNHGWRGGRTEGFNIDFESGEIISQSPTPPTRTAHPARLQRVQNVSLSVQDTQNLLILRPINPDLFLTNRALEVTFRIALQRGLEQVYQLEEDELASESIGRDACRALLFYETSEGGNGVLRRLIEEPKAFAEIARSALDRAHYTVAGEDQKPDCVAACYECLLSYSNQLDAMFIDRREVRSLLLDLSNSLALPRVGGRSYFEQLSRLHSLTDARSDLERRLLDALADGGYRLPADAQYAVSVPGCVADFYYAPHHLVFCDGSVHDQPLQKLHDQQLRQELQAHGYRVIVIRYDRGLEEQIQEWPDVFGVS